MYVASVADPSRAAVSADKSHHSHARVGLSRTEQGAALLQSVVTTKHYQPTSDIDDLSEKVSDHTIKYAARADMANACRVEDTLRTGY